MDFVQSNLTLDRSTKYTITDEGFIVTRAYLTRTGVFDYGSNKQLRPPEEVFNQKSLDTLKLKPITFHHPKEMVDAGNINKYQVGIIGQDVAQENDFITATLSITSKPAIDYIMDRFNSGKNVELSCGYWVELAEQSGQLDNENYDFVQKNIRYNHISIVEKGRAGENVRLLLDSMNNTGEDMEENTNVTAVIDVPVVETPEINLDAVNAQLDAAKKEVEILKAQLDESKSNINSVKNELEKVKLEKNELSEKIGKLEITDDLVAFDVVLDANKSIRDLKIDCIKKTSPNFDGNEKSDDYVNARFDAAKEFLDEMKKMNNNLSILSIKTAENTNVDACEKQKTKRDEMIEKAKKGEFDDK